MSEGAFGGFTALVIEDEAFTRLVVARMVGALGFKAVHQATDGASGLDAVRAHAPDIVLCDVEMVPIDGLGFLRELRASGNAGHAAVPVVFMTNRADEARMAEARALGADAFILKPVTPDALRATLGERLG